MAIGGGDGSIVLTTKVDESGLKNGLSSIKSGVGTLTTAIAGIGVAMIGATAAVVKGAKDTAAYGDRVDKLSQKIGMSNESFQQWDYIMQINGASIETLQAGMKTLSSAAENGSAAFDKLGISQEEVKNSSPEQLFETTISKLQEMGEGTERTAIAAQLLGRSATELGPLLNQNAESIDELKQRAIDYGFVMSDEAVAASAAFTDSLTTLSMTTTGLKNKLMSEFLPSLTSVTDGLALLMTGDMSGLDKINDGVNQFINQVSENLPKIMQIGGSIIKNLATAILDNLPSLLQSGIEIIVYLANGIVEALPNLINSIVSALPSLIETLVASLPTLIPLLINGLVQGIVVLVANLPQIIQPIIDYLPEIITSITGALIDNLPILIMASIQLVVEIVKAMPRIIAGLLKAVVDVAKQIGKTLFNSLPEPVQNAFRAAWEAVKAIWDLVSPYFEMIWNNIKAVFSVVKDVLSAFFKTAWEAIKAVWDIVTGYFKAIWDTIAGIFSVVKAVLSGDWSEAWEAIKGIVNTWADFFSGVWDSIKNVFASVGNFFKTSFLSAWDGIKEVFANVNEFFGGVWEKIKSAFKFDEMLQIGKNIVEGLWNGIKNAKDWLLNKIKSFAHTITDGIKSFFGIHSPSKVFRDEVGKNLMLGMAEGITGNERAVTMAMSRVQQGLANTSLATPAIVTGNVLPYHINAASSSIPTQIGSGATGGTETTVIREEHYYLSETELMTILHKLVKGGERLQGKTLISGGAY